MSADKRVGAFLKPSAETILPSVSGRLKSGAVVPNGSIVEAVITIINPFPFSTII
jgi:hypothetical protein